MNEVYWTVIINLILSAINAIMVGINIYLMNRRTKEGLKLSQREQRISILEKSGLSVGLATQKSKVELRVTNIGKLSIDNIIFDLCVLTESGETLLEKTYLRKDTLLKAEEFTIPISSILNDRLKEKEFLSFHEITLGDEFDPDSGRYYPVIARAWWAERDFSIDLIININYQVLGESKTQRNTFKIKYIVDPKFYGYHGEDMFIDSDNFRIEVQRISGEWK